MEIKITCREELCKITIASIRAKNKKLKRFEYSPAVGDTIRRGKHKAEVISVCDTCIIALVDGEQYSNSNIEWEYLVFATIDHGASFVHGF